MGKASRPEDALQITVAGFLRQFARKNIIWFHPPNGGNRGLTEGKIFKAMGVLPGVADIVVVCPDKRVAFLELKSAKGGLNANQRLFRDRCEALDIRYAIARTPEEATAVLWSWGAMTSNPLAHDAAERARA